MELLVIDIVTVCAFIFAPFLTTVSNTQATAQLFIPCAAYREVEMPVLQRP